MSIVDRLSISVGPVRLPSDTTTKEGDMHYMLLIYGDEAGRESRSEEEQHAMFGEYFAFSEAIRDQTVESAPLEPTATATTVRVRNGETLVTDGPFAETKEQLGGFYLIEA